MTTPVIDRSVSARLLIDEARRVFGVRSLYALARHVGLPPDYVQRYYQKNAIPLPARLLLRARIDAAT